MLDTVTKKRIDDCRDILVGKLPDPKAQIEQITIALIYKFMDDMDKEAIELGGKAKFFSGSYKKYNWNNLFDTRVTATEMLKLYSEAVESMEKNPNIPQLFRDIFKNAYLPYRDPETLKLFLKTIDGFEYSHSEKLGDAFEYLLSVMGSQGDAGQFRTPRHIIDFIVAVVNPGKTDTVLDPACGTAGFLISAFKHILASNKKGITPDERKKLIQNFVGYDISPDMVRLSLVNLYLHGFSDPHIWEYDTLSSEERWDETFDVILANPPFMSPKGGIRPHKKFSISSNRSEVLFVDYIAEHLNPKGRAGIIVPEGVIFQSGTAYKELRKMLVEKYLYAVVSLPAGVFNPYSGVKTSILLMDKEFAKKRNEILFVKIDNDGYNLGAQRIEIKGGQMTEAIDMIKQFRGGDISEGRIAHVVSKKEISKNGYYNLTGDRYRVEHVLSSDFKFVTISEVSEINPETIEPTSFNTEEFIYLDISSVENGTGKVNFNNTVKTNEAPSRARRKVRDNDIILSTVRPNLKAFGFIQNSPSNAVASTGFAILRAKEKLNPKFLFYNLFTDNVVSQMASMMGKGSYPSINKTDVGSIKIPLPPLSIQEEIVAEIEGYQKIIDGAKAVVENYKPKIDIDPEWEMVELGELFTKSSEGVMPQELESKTVNYIGLENIGQGSGELIGEYISSPQEIKSTKTAFKKGNILYGKLRPNLNKVYYSEINGVCSTDIFVLVGNKNVNSKFYSRYFLSERFNNEVLRGLKGAQLPRVGFEYFSTINIPTPPIEIQSSIISQIEDVEKLINASKRLIEIFEQKIKDRIAKVWGE